MTDAQVCIPNIGPGERRRRMVGGIVMVGVTLAAAAWLVTTDAPLLWRAFVVLPAFAAALGIFQARAQTCVALAARGTSNMDAGERRVGDAHLLTRMRQQSRRVLVQAAATATLVTVLVLVV